MFRDLLNVNDHRARDIRIDFERSHGSYLYDADSERELFDAFTFWSSLPLGYRHPVFERDDFKREILTAATYKCPSGRVYTDMLASFIERFHEACSRDYFSRYFFIHGGALAVDNAVKVAFDWKAAQNRERDLIIRPEEMKVVSFRNGFHGTSGFALSLTDVPPYKIEGFPKFDWPRFEAPGIQFPQDDAEDHRLDLLEPELEDLLVRYIEETGPEYIAAILIEPTQGGGGDHYFRDSWFEKLRGLCHHFGIALIFDEVQSGFGVTGTMWCYEHYGVKPDILIFGKKSQISGIAVPETVAEQAESLDVPGRLSVTWDGNIVDMVRCKYILEAYESDRLLENASTRGEQVRAGLSALGLANVRGMGLLCAFDFEDGPTRDAFMARALANGLLANPNGENRVRLRFNMAVTDAEIKHFLTLVKTSLG